MHSNISIYLERPYISDNIYIYTHTHIYIYTHYKTALSSFSIYVTQDLKLYA